MLTPKVRLAPLLLICSFGSIACGSSGDDNGNGAPLCQLVPGGFGPFGEVEATAEVVAMGLDVPWSIAWLPNGDLLVTERTGDLLRIEPDGTVLDPPIAQVPVVVGGEGGLLGLALHPDFATNRWIYLYYTAVGGDGSVNQVERWVMSEDGTSATADQIIVADIPATSFHSGGRLRFGPDDHLYVGTGDSTVPELSQDTDSLNGKVLRVRDDGSIPDDNPFEGSATWIYGLRNTQGFDWIDDDTMVVVDHGPTALPAEGGRRGHDEINVASAGDNLGWPDIYACETQEGMVSPVMTWTEALPPGGVAIYTGTEIPEWEGDAFIGVLGFGDAIGHLHRIGLSAAGEVETSEVYFRGDDGFGRLRDVIMGPDGALYATSSGCDGRGTCGEGDVIIRIGRP